MYFAVQAGDNEFAIIDPSGNTLCVVSKEVSLVLLEHLNK